MKILFLTAVIYAQNLGINITSLNETIVTFENRTNLSFGFMSTLFLKHIPAMNTSQGNNSFFIASDNGIFTLPWTLQANEERALVEYHSLSRSISVNKTGYYTTLSGSDIKIKKGSVYSGFNTTSTIVGQIPVGNSTVYFLDSILVPPPSIDDFLLDLDMGNFTHIRGSVESWPSEFTLFLPTKDAFEAFVRDSCGDITDFNVNSFSQIMAQHLISSKIYMDIATEAEFMAMSQTPLKVDVDDEEIELETKWSEAEITNGDVLLKHGVVHYINDVLLPRRTILCVERITNTITHLCTQTVAATNTFTNVITKTVTANAACTTSTLTMTTMTTRAKAVTTTK
jgi:uncharacterized surface protein with fasciclin (FAS1) repeats